jgi:O-succinylbenzoic acid--CoA ligase
VSAWSRVPPWLLPRAAATPHHPAVVCGGRTLDYAGLARAARALGACLRAAGLGPGDGLALLLGNGLPFVTALHASLLSGLRLTPLHARLTAGELLPQLRAVAPALLLCDAAHEARARAAAAPAGVSVRRIVEPDEADARRGNGMTCPLCGRRSELHALDAQPAPVELAAVAAVIFTSGTSGHPRGVCLSQGSLLAGAAASAFHLGASAADRWLACLPLFHVGGLAILVRSALQGSAVLVHERFDAGRLDEALDREAPTVLSLVPTMLARLLEVRGERTAPPSLRALLLGGAAAAPGLVERAWARGFPVLPTYGLTEAGSQVATAVLPVPGAVPTSAMHALPATELRVADASGRALPPGEAGEILVQGPGVMQGYLGDAEATAAALRGGWLHTGDLGVLAPDGALRVLDRRDDLVVTGGENVSPSEVEGALLAHPAVVDAAVAGLPDPDLGRRVAAWVVARPGAALDQTELRAFCRTRLAGHKVPREVRLVASLPRSATGKLLRAALADLPPPAPSGADASGQRAEAERMSGGPASAAQASVPVEQ